MLETWQLVLTPRGDRWEITGKDSLGSVSSLYKIKIPSGRTARARRVEIRHQDIRLSFRNAALFYDNIPDTETALIVVGKGTVAFTPSDANERHQMELLYKRKALEDQVNYAYVRCGGSFFSSNISVEGVDQESGVTKAETEKAAAIFSRNYPRSFTIENSIDGGLLSFLPNADEAVFEFKARKAGELTYIYSPFADEAVNLYDRTRQRIVSLYNPVDEADPKAKRFFISFGEKYDIASYELDLSYTPAQSYLSGKARILAVPRIEVVDSLKFLFSPDLEILKICDEQKRELFYTVDKLRKILYVYLINPLAGKAGSWIEVFYRGRMAPPIPNTDVVMQQTGYPEKFVFQPRYETYFFSQGSYWYPAPPDEDYFRARLKIVVPPEYKCVSNGEMVEKSHWEGMDDVVEIEKAGNAVYTFETREPVKYMSFIVGRFDRRKEWSEPVPIKTFVSSEVLNDNPGIFDEAKSILADYVRNYGPFPFEKLGIVLRLWPTAGGHSPASFVVMNQVPWISERAYVASIDSPVNLSKWGEYFLAHEIAHQWWGQGVSFATYRDQWLSEGLAQFASASYLRQKHGERAFAEILKKFVKWTAKKSGLGAIIMGSRLSFYDFEAYQAVIYDKAALALFMLQDILGKDIFLAGLRSFFETRKYTAARTEDFISDMEKASGQDLRDFFRGWFWSYELPEVQTSWSQEEGPEGTSLRIRVTQTKGRFVFPLWVEWKSGETLHRDLIVVRQGTQEAVLKVPGHVDKVRFDPDGEVPGKFF
jgi:hypothetical protein